VKRYTDFAELTVPMLHEFVEKVSFTNRTNPAASGAAGDIYLNFIGCFAVPNEDEAASEQLAAEEEKRAACGVQAQSTERRNVKKLHRTNSSGACERSRAVCFHRGEEFVSPEKNHGHLFQGAEQDGKHSARMAQTQIAT
jgi:hypothetical protein